MIKPAAIIAVCAAGLAVGVYALRPTSERPAAVSTSAVAPAEIVASTAKAPPPPPVAMMPRPASPIASAPPRIASAPSVPAAEALPAPASEPAPQEATAPAAPETKPKPETKLETKLESKLETKPEPAPAVAAPAPVTPPVGADTAKGDITPAPAPAPAAAPAAPSPAPTPPPVLASLPPAPAPADRPAIVEQAIKGEPIPAKKLFAAEKLPSLGKAMAIGYYPRGCLQGGVALPVTGPTWQVMRISRNRMWGHPNLVRFLERFAPAAAKATGWHGILIGDMAQPRGGPLPFGHLSHQIGLDVDVWFVPMPNHVLSGDEREKISEINLVAADWKNINSKTWTPKHYDFIRVAAEQPGVERVLVNAAIKKEMCRMQGANHPDWMDKVRPWYGHHDHIHVRLACPPDSPSCRKQPPVPESDGCGKALDYWFSDRVLHPKPKPPNPNAKPPKPITLADLPPACKTVLAAPDKQVGSAE